MPCVATLQRSWGVEHYIMKVDCRFNTLRPAREDYSWKVLSLPSDLACFFTVKILDHLHGRAPAGGRLEDTDAFRQSHRRMGVPERVGDSRAAVW